MVNETLKQQKIRLANSPDVNVVLELMKDCRTNLTTIIAENEFKTMVNTITLESELNMIRRVAEYIEDIKRGILNES